LIPYVAADSTGSSGFNPPSIEDFFPPTVLFADTPFALNRVMLIRILVVILLVLFLWLGTRRMKLIPGRGQVMVEFLLTFPRKNIVIDTLGEKDGNRFMPLIMTIFFVTLGMNLTGVVPGLQLAGTSVVGIPLIQALIAFVMFIYAGIRKFGVFGYLKKTLFLPGVPWPLYILLTPVEIISTFLVRPITLVLRLLMNLIAGHMLLALCWAATDFFLLVLLPQGDFLGLLGLGTFGFGIVFFGLELFVAILQAYVFAILTAIYIQLSLAEEH
jgi:F-type H+-transporting ATPase subunit a